MNPPSSICWLLLYLHLLEKTPQVQCFDCKKIVHSEQGTSQCEAPEFLHFLMQMSYLFTLVYLAL